MIAWLTQQVASGSWIVDWDESQEDLISFYASESIFARQFASFSCPACEMEFSSLECAITEWELSEGNETRNGRRLICPSGHTVYAATEQMCIDFVHAEPKIDEENMAPFRAALMATDDTLTSGAGADGKILRLETIDFKQSWIVDCDKYLADPDRSAEDRAKALRRREAFLPVLERPLLHGVVSYNNSIFRVLVDKASNQVILCEIE
ncbi:MAG TPA: hypothetical protein VK961_08540 [Chthoniobacter sp.]|nr:hypothetical protein [Chthoniobacter sp.]